MIDAALASEDFCYVSTAGRVTGRTHEIEIWFQVREDTLYILAGGGLRSDWVKNIRKTPAVVVRIAGARMRGRARLVVDRAEDTRARQLLLEKYAPRYGGDLADWGRTATPVAIDLDAHPDPEDARLKPDSRRIA